MCEELGMRMCVFIIQSGGGFDSDHTCNIRGEFRPVLWWQGKADSSTASGSESLKLLRPFLERDAAQTQAQTLEGGLRLQTTEHLWGVLLVQSKCCCLYLYISCSLVPPCTSSKPPSVSGSVCRYINALEAATAQFSTLIARKVLRSKEEIAFALSDSNRHSNSEYWSTCHYQVLVKRRRKWNIFMLLLIKKYLWILT